MRGGVMGRKRFFGPSPNYSARTFALPLEPALQQMLAQQVDLIQTETQHPLEPEFLAPRLGDADEFRRSRESRGSEGGTRLSRQEIRHARGIPFRLLVSRPLIPRFGQGA